MLSVCLSDSLRDEGGFKRTYDGHVYLQARNGGWVETRLDAKVPGTVLLRDDQGYVHYITYSNIQQVGRWCLQGPESVPHRQGWFVQAGLL